MQLGKNEQHQKSLSLLQLFSYKTYQDYLGESLLCLEFHVLMKPANKDVLPPLNQAQIIKLKHLSIVSLATYRRVSLIYWRSYSVLHCLFSRSCPIPICNKPSTSQMSENSRISLSMPFISISCKGSLIRRRSSWKCRTRWGETLSPESWSKF